MDSTAEFRDTREWNVMRRKVVGADARLPVVLELLLLEKPKQHSE